MILSYTNISKSIVFLLLFGGINLLSSMEIDIKSYWVVLMIISFIIGFKYQNNNKRFKGINYLLLFLILFSIFKLYTDRGLGTRTNMLVLLGTPFFLSSLPNPHYYYKGNYRQFWKSIIRFVFCAFIIECVISIIERICGFHVFSTSDFSIDDIADLIGFRSFALYGHPLTNTLIVSIGMNFILISPLNIKYKYSLWTLGFLAILCFNSRSGAVFNFIFLIIYLLHSMMFDKKMLKWKKLSIFLIATLIFIIGYYAIYTWGFGDRLLIMGLYESSAQVRVDNWDLISDLDWTDLLGVHSFDYFESLKNQYHTISVENWFLIFLIYHGILFLILYIILYFILLQDILKYYTRFDKLFATITFLLIATTTNSIASSFFPLYYFILLCLIFNPYIFKKSIKR